MIGKNQKFALNLTQQILEEYWFGNSELLLKYIHPEILWIGSTDSEYVHGAKEMKKRVLENNSEMPPVFLDEQEYEVIPSGTTSCLIVGRYRAYTKPDSGILLSEKQRVSFLWVKERREDASRIQIRHIHLSNILKMQGEDEFFPVREGKKNFENMKNIISGKILEKTVTVKDIDQVTRVFNFNDVVYLKADRNYTEFYINGKVRVARVRENISKFALKLPEEFLKVSRSLLVNRNYIKSLKGRNLMMLDGVEIQIPAARCAFIRDELNQI